MITRQNSSIRIGGASGFWGDSAVGPLQLVEKGHVDYLVFDYLAELTMSILAGAKLKNPEMGYATDFVGSAMASVLPKIIAKGIRVVSNAGGTHPEACANALRELATTMGIPLKVSVVQGDDLMPIVDTLAQAQIHEMNSGQALPESLVSANAYLGAEPICAALAGGADVVITGRCVDSAVTLGILMHEFGWRAGDVADLDRLAQGSLAGHLIECGAQGTGGLFTDWQTVPDWAHIGYPIVVCEPSGRFCITKPPGTGGLISCPAVAEQLVYEIGDPSRYLLPDVVCDFTQVSLRQLDTETVEVLGARGRPPTARYKVSATYLNGYRCSGQLTIVGMDAVAKAKRTGQAIVERTSEMLRDNGFARYTGTHIEVLGAESAYGPLAHWGALATREAVLRLTVTHPKKSALGMFARELAPAGTSFSPGTTGAGGGRPSVSPNIRQFAFLWPKSEVSPSVSHHDGRTETVPTQAMPQRYAGFTELAQEVPDHLEEERIDDIGSTFRQIPNGTKYRPLIDIAYARSGDKGDISNIGVIARKPEWLPILRQQLTEAAVAGWLKHLVKGPVRRYELPGIHAFNFVCEQALDGGGMASMRNDALGKGMAQILLSLHLWVPDEDQALKADANPTTA